MNGPESACAPQAGRTAGPGACGPAAFRVRLARAEDLKALLVLYERARAFMAAAGNPGQWVNGYPGPDVLAAGIAAHCHYVLEDGAGALAASFYFAYGSAPEPSYGRIDGAWLRNGPYGVLHRIAAARPGAGAAGACIAWCWAHSGGDLRADTHEKNLPMQRILEKAGFVRCGTIRLADGSPRWAYQKLARPAGPMV